MDDRKWEELKVDCLVNIFTKVGLASLVDGVPLVCKSWYKATLDPLCWESLVFTEAKNKVFKPMPAFRKQKLIEAFAKFVIRRSQGATKVVNMGYAYCRPQVIKLICDGCPCLKRLMLHCHGNDWSGNFPSMMCKWKNLEVLETYGYVPSLVEFIRQVSINCEKIVSLSVIDHNDIGEEEAIAISTGLPNIEFLSFTDTWINRREVVTILEGCRKLVHFDAGRWFDYSEDAEIKKLAAHITTFKFDVYDN